MSDIKAQTHDGGTLFAVPTGTWQIDPAHSALGFAARHLMSKVRGRFNEFSGQITIAEDRLQSSAQVEVALASVNTGNEIRDNHLRSNDFFASEDHPTMSFTSIAMEEADGSWALDGKLTIRHTTRVVQFDVDFLGFDPTGQQGEARIGFEGRASINRSDFGVSYGLADKGKLIVGDQVDIQLEIEAVLT